jgi:ribosomal protein S18 acetylase RimI-like enzyme
MSYIQGIIMAITYRNGKKEESLRIAELIDIAAGGTLNYLFHDLVPNMTPVQLIAQGLATENPAHSYTNTIVAIVQQHIVGMALSYPSAYHQITEEMRQFLPADRLEHFQQFYAARIDQSLFLDAICVDEHFRGQNIGSELIGLTKRRAREQGYPTVSLIVFADNIRAQRLYRRCGFQVVQQVELRRHAFIPHDGGCLVMQCGLD